MKFIAICHEGSTALAQYELQTLQIESAVLAPGVLLGDSQRSFEELSLSARRGELIFLRYLAPVALDISAADCDAARVARELVPLLSGAAGSVALHVRALGLSDSSIKREFVSGIIDELRAAHIVVERKTPVVIAAVLLTQESVYLGVCSVEQALSSWSGGEVRYRHDERQMVSRAELKLVEATDIFHFEPPRELPVLDLGAAPGGWTRILAHQGYRVVAIDPAKIDARVLQLRGVIHHKSTAEQFLSARHSQKFGALVNDMRMSPCESAQIMLDCASLVVTGGLALMTIKIEKRGVERIFSELIDTFALLEREYARVATRQLFHNRSECTVLLKRKGSSITLDDALLGGEAP